jgi:hypothetical protein
MDYSEIKIDDERDTLIKFDKFEWNFVYIYIYI